MIVGPRRLARYRYFMTEYSEEPIISSYHKPRRWCLAGNRAEIGPFAKSGSLAETYVNLTEVSDVPCLVLLGEAGSGKTTELMALFEKLRESGLRVDYIAGRDIAWGNERLVGLLAEKREYRTDEREPWHVLIDGVDEIGSLDGNGAVLLGSFLDKLQAKAQPDQRLCVAMTSRTAEWSAELDMVVEDRWAQESLRKLALEPLDDAEIRMSIATIEQDPRKRVHLSGLLLDENLRSIAGRPRLLGMLLNRYEADGELPKDQSALFQDTVEFLVADVGGMDADLTISRRLLLAGRIAAACTFSGVYRIATGVAADVANCLIVNRIAGGTEPSAGGDFAVAPAGLASVLESDLFVRIDQGIYEFRDRAFQEFLTARYLVDHRLSPDQMMSLLTVQEVEGPGGVAPQLQEVAAWAAAMTPAVFDRLMLREPDVLLKSDATAMSSTDRAKLTAAVLARFADPDLLDRRDVLVRLFVRLDHQELAGQLEAIIVDRSAPRGQRLVAIDIAMLTGKAALVAPLLKIAHDGSDDVLIRTWAVRAVGKLGSAGDVGTLAAILRHDLSDDDEDRLRGALLQLCWPAHLEFGELLNALTPLKKRNHIGTYYLFLQRLRFRDLIPASAVEVVDWLRSRLAVVQDRNDGLDSVMERLFWVAANRIEFEEVRSAFADLILEAGSALARFSASSRISDEDWSKKRSARSSLVAETLGRSLDPVRSTSVLLHILPDLVIAEDLDDYLAILPQSTTAVRTSIAQIVVTLTDRMPIDELSAVWEAADQIPELRTLLAQRYTVDRFSQSAEFMRGSISRKRKAEAEREQLEEVSALRLKRILTLLDRIQSGEPEVWWQLNHEMMRDQSGHRSEFEFRADLTATPGWELLEDSIRQRVVATAFVYLTDAPLADTTWLGTSTSHRPANAGVRALRLLNDEAPEKLAELADDTWAAWTPALISFFDNAFDGEDAQSTLVQDAWRHAPDAVLEAIRRIALGPDSEGLTTRTFELIEAILHPPVVALLQQLRHDPDLRGTDTNSSIFSFLVRMEVDGAVREVARALENRAAGGDDARSEEGGPLSRAAADLLLQGSVRTWDQVLRLRPRDEAMAMAVWREVADEVAFGRLRVLDDLDAWSLAQGYIDLAELLPERPSTESGVRVLGVPDHVERLRTIIVGRLVEMGTNSALQQLERISTSIPGERDALRWRINETRRNVRANTAIRPDPSDILIEIDAMGRTSGRSDDPPTQTVEAFIDEADDVPIEMDLPAPAPVPSGPLPPNDTRTILAVATEWSSISGGISTLNRELCKALAALGHAVICLVRSAGDAEVAEARAAGVSLIGCPTSEGIDDGVRYLLCGERELGTRPQIVIGHDHITGQFGRALAHRFDAKYVHFLHTIPQENEGLKGDRGDKPRGLLSGDEKLRAQIRLAAVSSLVVAIGPRIERTFSHEATNVPKVVTFIPGLNEILLTIAPSQGRTPINQCLMIGRMEDAGVKGVQLACDFMKAVVEGRLWPSGQTPMLRIRGFSPEGADAEIEVIQDFKAKYARFVSPRGYSIDAEQLRNELERTGLFVMPSVAEGFGLTGYEAIAAGIPVIVSAESGLAEFLRAEVTSGLLDHALVETCIAPVASTPERNAADWQKKVEDVLSNRASAFERAERLRKALAITHRWEAAARRLSAELTTL